MPNCPELEEGTPEREMIAAAAPGIPLGAQQLGVHARGVLFNMSIS